MTFNEKIEKMKLEKKALHLAIAVAILLLVIFIASGFDYGHIDTSFYSVKNSELKNNVRIVMITDLHSREFGDGNSELLEKIESLNPDIIAVVGDVTTRYEKSHEVALNFLKDVTKIAPVYYSYGNHEYSEILFDEGSTLRKDIKNTGVTLVNNSSVTVEVNGSMFSIGGFCASTENFVDNAEKFMSKYVETDGIKLLLCHHPECFSDGVMDDYPVDLALCGHSHGGQIRLPLVGAIFAPGQGLFPNLTEGEHNVGGSKVIVSRGLGNSKPIPRFNNNPEICVIDLRAY